MKVAPYLFFDGRAEEAIEYYRRVLGAEVERMVRFKDNPEPQPGMTPPGAENKIMHADLRIGDTVILMSDGRCAGKPEFRGFALSLYVANNAEAESRFNALSDGGQVQLPLRKTFFSSNFGMVMDRFGVMWMVLVER
jgi:PhnB protein